MINLRNAMDIEYQLYLLCGVFTSLITPKKKTKPYLKLSHVFYY